MFFLRAAAEASQSAHQNKLSRSDNHGYSGAAAATLGGRLRGSYSGSSGDGDDDAFASDSYLANWMGAIAPALAHATLLDMALPGTHDTMTYDLTTVSPHPNPPPPPILFQPR
jgi:hypothetical protein